MHTHTSSSSSRSSSVVAVILIGGVVACGGVSERAREGYVKTSQKYVCCAQMPKNERLRFWKSHTHRIHTHTRWISHPLLLSPSQLEHSIYTLKASQPPQFGKHSRPTIYTTPSALTAAISVIIDEPRFVVSGFPHIYIYTCTGILYYKHALRRLPVAVPRMYLYAAAAISSLYYYYYRFHCTRVYC